MRRLHAFAPFVGVGALAAALPALALAFAGTTAAVIVAAATLGGLVGLAIGLARDTRARLVRHEQQLTAWAAEVTAQLDALATLPQKMADVVGSAESRLHKAIADRTRERAHETRQAAKQDFRQLESLLNLHALISVRGAVPAARGWAASPDLLQTYVGEILLGRPSLVVECGSGLSTLWAAYALQLCGSGRVVALEHDEHYLEQTRTLLDAHGLTDHAEVRHAPIRDTKVNAQPVPWYDTDQIQDLYDVGLLLVDGPIGSLATQSRYPALPLFRERLSRGAAILLDDADRPEETAIAERWSAEWPELHRIRLPHEKGAVLLRVPGGDGATG